MKILLIEDNPADQEFVKELIGRFSEVRYETVIADRVAKALPHFTDDEVAVILLDLNLPDSRSLETFTTVQRLAGHIPIIILTGIEDDGLAVKAVEGGAQDYLEKGLINAQVLQKAIQYAIERNRIRRELKETASRLKAEEELLKTSETLYRAVFEATGAATVIIDGNGTILRANCEAEALLGYTPAELEGKARWSEFVPPDELPRLAEYWRLLHEDPTRSSRHCEAKLVDRNGRIKYGILSVGLIPHSRNCVVSITDITERRRADEVIGESEERFRGLFDHMASGGAVYQAIDGGTDFIFRDFNAAAERIEGIAKGELIGRRVTEVFPGVKELGLLGVMQRVWEKGVPEYLPPSLYRDDRDEGTWRENWVYRLPTGDLVVVYNDVTRRMQAEEALKEAEEKYRTVLESVPDLIIVHRNGTIRYVNNSGTYTMGLPVSEVLGKSIFDFIVPEFRDRVTEAMRKREGGDWVEPYEIEILTKSGKRTVVISGSRIRYEGSPAILNVLTDVTERKKAEESLGKSEEKYRTVFENTGTATVVVEENGLISLANAEFVKLSGYSREEIEGKKTWTGFVVKEDLERMQEQHRLRREDHDKALRSYEFRFVRRNGEIRNIHLTIDMIPGTTRSIASLLDFTERKKVEDSLRLTQFSVDTASDAIMWLRSDGSFFYVNEAACEMLGYSRDTLLTMAAPDINTEHLREAWPSYWEKLREAGALTFENTLVAADGHRIPVEITANYLEFGGQAFNCSYIHDLRDRKKAEAALRESEEKYRTLTDMSPGNIYVIDQEGFIRFVNPAAAARFNRGPADLVGKHLKDVFPPPLADQHLARIRKVIVSGQPTRSEIREEFPTGEYWNKAYLSPIRDKDNNITAVMGISFDMTDRKLAEEKIAHLASFPDLNPNPVIELDPSGEVRYANPALRATLRKYGMGDDPRAFLPPDFGTILPALLKGDVQTEVQAGGRVFLETLSLIPGFGTRRIYIRDITDRKRAEEALRKSEARLAEAMDLAHLANWEFDVPTGIFTFDDRFYALYGTTAEREGGYQMPAEVYAREFCHPDDVHVVADEVKKAIETTDPNYTRQLEHRIIRRDGEIRYITVRIAITKDENGRTIKTHGANQDITDRKKAEEALIQSEARYREFFTTSRDAVFITSLAGQWVDFNDAAVDLFGYESREALQSQPIASFYEDPEERRSFTALIIRDGFVKEHPVRLLKKDGTVIDTLITAVPLRGNDGSVSSFVGSIRDVTERRRIEEALRRSEERFRGVVESQTEFITRFNPDSRVTFANDAYLKYFGLDGNEIIGKKFKPHIPEEDREMVREHFASLSRENPVGTLEHRIIMPDGTVRWQRWVDRGIFDEEGNLVEYQSVGRDITEQKEAEAALRESEEKYRNLVELADTGITIIQEGVVEYANQGLAKIWGGETDTLIGTPLADLVHPEEREKVLDRYRKRIAGEQVPAVYETLFLRRDRSLYPAEIHAGVITYRGRPADLVLVQDITERKQVVKALQESQGRYRQIVEGTNAGVWVFDNDFTTIYANEQMASMLGVRPDEMVGRSISDFVFPEDHAEMHEIFAAIGNGTAPDTELRLRRSDRMACWLRVAAGPFYDVLGQRVGFTGIFSDVTQRRVAEEAVKEAEKKYRSIVEFAVEGIYQIDTRGRFLTANTAMARILGYDSVDGMMGAVTDTARQVWADPRQRGDYLSQLKRDGVVNGFEAEYLRRDGSRIWVSLNTRAVRGADGTMAFSEGTVEDITQRKLAEKALRESEEMFRNPVEQSPVGVFLVQDGIILYANPRVAEVAGYSRPEILGRPFDALIHPDDLPKVLEVIGRLLKGEVSAGEVEYRAVRKDGSVFAVQAYGSQMPFRGRAAVYGTLIDITERKKMENQIKGSLKEKEVLLREIHHRVKNNMQVISSLLSVQSQTIKDDTIRGLFKESQNRIRSIALVHELLYQSANLDQIEYGEYLKKMFIPLFESYNIDQRKVSIAIDAARVMIAIDKAVSCSLIVNELISNSLKHAFPGDRKGAITIRFGLDTAGGEYILEYGDNGVGLPPGLDVKTLKTLGMRLIALLTKQLDGTLEMVPGEGTRFRISFPAGSGRNDTR